MQSNLGQPRSKIALADGSQPAHLTVDYSNAYKTVCRMTPKTQWQYNRLHGDNPRARAPTAVKDLHDLWCNPAQDNLCADWSHLARTRRCGQTKTMDLHNPFRDTTVCRHWSGFRECGTEATMRLSREPLAYSPQHQSDAELCAECAEYTSKN